MQIISLYNFQKGSGCRELVIKISKGGSGRSLNNRWCRELVYTIFKGGSGCRELVNKISKRGAVAPTAPPCLRPWLHLATSFLDHQSITSSMLMTLSSSFLSLHATSHKTFNSYKTPFLKSLPGWLPTSFLSTPLKLNFYSLVFLHSSLKLIILLYLCPQALPSNLLLLLEILVLSSTQN